jgi:hypothetical protein
MIHHPGRVEAIRQRISAKLESLSQMEDAATDPGFRVQLSLARNRIADVETDFIAVLARQSRTRREESIWLGFAEIALQMAEERCTQLEDDFQKYGPDVKYRG